MPNKNKPVKNNHGFLGMLANLRVGEEKQYFIENLTMLLASGMDIMSVLESIRQELKSKTMLRIVDDLRSDIAAGSNLWQALSKVKVFSEQAIALIKLGEESGRLAENLEAVVKQQEKERIFNGKLRSAMVYPTLILVVTLVVGLGITWFILPRLANVFSQLRIELPTLTRGLIGAGDFLRQYGIMVIPGLLLFLAVLVFFVFIWRRTKKIGQTILFYVPGVRRLILETETARFGYVLGSLLNAGLPIVEALESLYQAATFRHYKKLYGHLLAQVKEGHSLFHSLSVYPGSQKLIPRGLQTMIYSGENSGNLANILLKISATYDAKIENTTKNLAVILEPVLLVIVWLGVVGLALAVILPIYSLIGGLN